MAASQQIEVCVIYARPGLLFEQRCTLGSPATILDALEASGLSASVPEIDWTVHSAGVFGKVLPLDHVLTDGDRVEVYRPLPAKPKAGTGARAKPPDAPESAG